MPQRWHCLRGEWVRVWAGEVIQRLSRIEPALARGLGRWRQGPQECASQAVAQPTNTSPAAMARLAARQGNKLGRLEQGSRASRAQSQGQCHGRQTQ